jgi:hypothetical protein
MTYSLSSVQFFKTKPYACQPSSLPKYAPNKEMDAKLREDSLRLVLLNIGSLYCRQEVRNLGSVFFIICLNGTLKHKLFPVEIWQLEVKQKNCFFQTLN